MASITTLEGMNGRPRPYGRRRFFGDCTSEFIKRHDAIMAKYAAMAKANNNELTYEMSLARSRELDAFQAEEAACFKAEEAAKKAPTMARAPMPKTGTTFTPAPPPAPVPQPTTMVRAPMPKTGTTFEPVKETFMVRAPSIFTSPPSNGPGLLPPQPPSGPGLLPEPTSTGPGLAPGATSPDTAPATDDPMAEEEVKKPNYILPLLALGVAYLALKG